MGKAPDFGTGDAGSSPVTVHILLMSSSFDWFLDKTPDFAPGFFTFEYFSEKLNFTSLVSDNL